MNETPLPELMNTLRDKINAADHDLHGARLYEALDVLENVVACLKQVELILSRITKEEE